MSESSQNSSFCTQCNRERYMTGKDQLNNLLNPSMYSFKLKDLKDAETRFHKLQKQIMSLKQQNEKKIETIQVLKKQMIQKPRKSSVQIQIEQNKKSFEQLKSSLLSFGHKGLNGQSLQKNIQKKEEENSRSSLNNGSVSTQIIINSLQKRLKQYKIQLLKLIQKVQLHEKSTEWMYQFIDSFLKMVIEINKSGKYGDQLNLKELSIKKRTKIAWNYLKNLLQKVLNS